VSEARVRGSRAGGRSLEAALAPLLETVADEARREAEGLVDEAHQRAELHVSETERSAQRIEADAIAAGREEGRRLARRRIALAELEARHASLRSKASLVDQAVDLAITQLAARAEGGEAEAFLGAALRVAARVLGGSGLRVRVRLAQTAQARAALDAVGLSAELEATETADAGAWVATADGRRAVDMTLGGILDRRREEARRAAARTLFAKRGAP
jgi:vacuolar-type H+-ATPase subunit E/Vma4